MTLTRLPLALVAAGAMGLMMPGAALAQQGGTQAQRAENMQATTALRARIVATQATVKEAQDARKVSRERAATLQRQIAEVQQSMIQLRTQQGFVSAAELASYNRTLDTIDAELNARGVARSHGADKATLVAHPVPNFTDIMVPEIGGSNGPAAQRINATLATIRDQAVSMATQCRTSAGSTPFSYRYVAQPTYNDHGVLSLRFTGEGQCGGATGATIMDAHTFDLTTGEEVNVVEVSGKPAAELATLAVLGYSGGADCRTFLAGDEGSLGSAFVSDRGVGVNYAVSVGAAASCTAEPGFVSWAALAGGLKAPLAALVQPTL